ncbi:MAG: heme ABC exporter ATP-binding protein CcmA [Leptospiraceae bacterium]|nr:heme ABC exporter ATP-binding protein CcmA [Leptospiraceae bacterium]
MNAADATELLRIDDLRYSYGYRQALQSVHLTIQRGELVCLLGPNGAGKSTLLRALTTRNGPDGGDMYFQSQRLHSVLDRQKFLQRVAYLGHMPGLMLDLSALENLQFIAGLYQNRYDTRTDDRIHELLKLVGLETRAHDRVRGFSRGMQQRLGLARIFLIDPKLILLDEPLTGLDFEGEQTLHTMLKHFLDAGGAVLAATHSETVFADLAARYVFLKDGRVIADVPREKYNSQASEKIKSMLYGDF